MKEVLQHNRTTQLKDTSKNSVSQCRPKVILQDNRSDTTQLKSSGSSSAVASIQSHSALSTGCLERVNSHEPIDSHEPTDSHEPIKGHEPIQNKSNGEPSLNESENTVSTSATLNNNNTPIQRFPGGKWAMGAIGAIGGAAAAMAGPALAATAGIAGTAATVATGGLALAGAGLAMGGAYLAHKGYKKAKSWVQPWRAARASEANVRTGGRPGLANKVSQIGNVNERAWMADIMEGDNRHAEGGAANIAGGLPFNPRMKFQLSPADYANLATAPRLADPKMHFNAVTHEVHTAYNPQQLLEVDNGLFMSQLNVDAMNAGDHAGTLIDRQSGNPQALDQEQQDRVDLLHDTHERVNNFDYAGFDGQFTNHSMGASDTALGLAADGPAATDRLLNTEGHDGFALGEDHGDPSTREFLADNMQDLAANQNVNTVYMEHIRHEYQPSIDAWLATAPGTAMPRDLDNFVTRFDINRSAINPLGNLRRVLTQAHQHGVRVRSIDSRASQQTLGAGRNDALPLRAMTMNTFGEQQIRADAMARAGGKYVILAGAAHNNTQASVNNSPHGGFNKGLPGFSQLLNIPAVTVNAGGTLDLDRDNVGNR